MGEKWILLFFNRRWTRINADAGRELALLIVKRAIALYFFWGISINSDSLRCCDNRQSSKLKAPEARKLAIAISIATSREHSSCVAFSIKATFRSRSRRLLALPM